MLVIYYNVNYTVACEKSKYLDSLGRLVFLDIKVM